MSAMCHLGVPPRAAVHTVASPRVFPFQDSNQLAVVDHWLHQDCDAACCACSLVCVGTAFVHVRAPTSGHGTAQLYSVASHLCGFSKGMLPSLLHACILYHHALCVGVESCQLELHSHGCQLALQLLELLTQGAQSLTVVHGRLGSLCPKA